MSAHMIDDVRYDFYILIENFYNQKPKRDYFFICMRPAGCYQIIYIRIVRRKTPSIFETNRQVEVHIMLI